MKRRILSVQLYQDPFEIPDKCCNFTLELLDKFTNIFLLKRF